MFIYLIFIKLIYLAIQKDFTLLTDKIFKKNYDIQTIFFDDCKQYDKDSFHYRGRPTNIKDIINSSKLKKYKYVYLPEEEEYVNNITLFPKSTIFFVSYIKNKTKLKEYCIIQIYNNKIFEKYNHFYYIIIGKDYLNDISEIEMLDNYIRLLIIFGIYFLIVNLKIIYSLCSYYYIHFFLFPFLILIMNNPNVLLLFDIRSYFFPFIFYSFNKTLLYVRLIFMVKGYDILNHESPYGCKFLKFAIFFLIFDLIITILFLYIIYFIPSLNNFYLFSIKIFIYYIYLFIITIKSIKHKLIPLYRQYKFEQMLRSFLVIGYKAKLIIYIKLLIFSIIYSLSNIILPIFQYIYINEYTEAFFINHCINIICELILTILFSIFFFPKKMTIFFYLPVIFDYNFRRITTIIGKENKNINNISNLTKKTLKKKHIKEKLPIILIKPYDNIDFSYDYLKLGTIENKK